MPAHPETPIKLYQNFFLPPAAKTLFVKRVLDSQKLFICGQSLYPVSLNFAQLFPFCCFLTFLTSHLLNFFLFS